MTTLDIDRTILTNSDNTSINLDHDDPDEDAAEELQNDSFQHYYSIESDFIWTRLELAAYVRINDPFNNLSLQKMLASLDIY
jgi:hypothetical protein